MTDEIIKKIAYEDGEMDTHYRRRTPLPKEGFFMGMGHYAPFNQRTYTAAPGIICEQDVPVKLRDGNTIYTDIYRPVTEEKVPVLVAWSFYGKRPYDRGGEYMVPGVPEGTISEMTKFEGPDPSWWCRHGYAVANPDPRGIGHSEGDATLFGRLDGKDCADFIDWIGEQLWCNGNVGMLGNSMLAITQWFAAAEQPKHLKAIAPWEGASDLLRELNFEDGVPAIGFVAFALGALGGDNYVEDEAKMSLEHPFLDTYWKDKIPNFEKIEVPVYASAGWQHVHLRGTVNAFEKISSKEKWIRFHREFEWPDQYAPENREDALRFFDRYLKNIHNGWEFTPRVRLEVMDAYEYSYQVNRPEKEWPLARTQYKTLYLNAEDSSLQEDSAQTENSVFYDAEIGEAVFNIRFNEDVEITGHSSLKLWVEADGNDDMDLFITMFKQDSEGNFVPTSVVGQPHPGAWGKLRVSHRALDESESKPYFPVHSHLVEEKLEPREIVPVEIYIYPTSRLWHKGEQLKIRVAGRYIRDHWFEPFTWETNNKGRHIIHTGGQYDSKLIIPVVPPKYQVGDYVYR